MRSSLLTPASSPLDNKMILVPFSEQPVKNYHRSYNQPDSPKPGALCYFDASPRSRAITLPPSDSYLLVSNEWYPTPLSFGIMRLEPDYHQNLGGMRNKDLYAKYSGTKELVDYARYNENFVLVVTSSCCIRCNSTGYQGRSPWLVRSNSVVNELNDNLMRLACWDRRSKAQKQES
jgi:hypothetical protein